MAVALFGVVLVITRGDPSSLLHGDGRAGDLLVLGGVASFVAYTTGARRFTGFSPLRYTALSATGGTLTILAVTALLTLTGTYPLPSAGDWGAAAPQTAYIILAGAVIGVLAWNEGVRADRRRQRRAVHEPGPGRDLRGRDRARLPPGRVGDPRRAADDRRARLRQPRRPSGAPPAHAARVGSAQSPSSRTPSSSAPRWCASSWRTVRVTCARSRSGWCPKSRSSVSRKMMMRSW